MSSVHLPIPVADSSYAPSDDILHTGITWASATTTDPWDPAILTLDGGGIRGYSSLLIMEALMHEVAIEERRQAQEDRPRRSSLGDPAVFSSPAADTLLPCHYFDYMYGTSTGGLIATMLGRLRMSVPQCLEIYRDVGETLFGKRRSKIPLTTKYSHKPLEKAVRDIVRTHCKQHDGKCDGNDWHPWDDEITNKAEVNFDEHICQSICLTAVHNGRIDEAHLLRTYPHRYDNIPNWISPYNAGADHLKIWQVTRATSAAPFYFATLEVSLNDENWTFKDGGIRENNPSGAAWSEFISLYGEGRDPALLLSLGTGRPDMSQDGFASAWPGPFGHSSMMKKMAEKFAVFKNVLIKYTDGEDKHKDMVNTARGEHTWYKRLNVSTGLGALPLDQWRRGEWTDPKTGITSVIPGGETLTQMEKVTKEYLQRNIDHKYDTYAPPKVMLRQTAEKLVRQRRARQAARAKSPKRWDTYMGKYLTGEYIDQVDAPIDFSAKPDSNEHGRRGSIQEAFRRASVQLSSRRGSGQHSGRRESDDHPLSIAETTE